MEQIKRSIINFKDQTWETCSGKEWDREKEGSREFLLVDGKYRMTRLKKIK